MKRNWLFIITFALVFYALGAGYVESFVNYRTWHLIGPEEFQDYHHALGPRIIAVLVIPAFSLAIFTFALIWVRPAAIPRWSAVAAFAMIVLMIISSITIQIPIQRELGQNGLSIQLIDRLILTDWIRKILMTINAVLFLWMMSRVLRGSREELATDEHR
jgi:hypothetical protein